MSMGKPGLGNGLCCLLLFLLGWLCPVVAVPGTTEQADAAASLPEAQHPPYIHAISIKGASALSQQQILAVMLSRPKGFAFWQETYFDPAILEADLDRIVQLYKAVGYYDVQVTHSIAILPDNGRDVLVTIVEGRPVRISSLVIESALWPDWFVADLGGIVQRDTRVRRTGDFVNLPLRIGDVFTANAYQQAKKLILTSFANHGYAKVEVRGVVKLYREEQQADLRLMVSPGLHYQVGAVAIQGTNRVAPFLIRRNLQLRPGQEFSLATLLADRRRLGALDLFQTVSIRPDWDNVEGDRVPLLITVKEKPPRGLKVGIGYGTEDKARILASVHWRNFLGRGYTVRLTGRYSALKTLFENSFENPFLWGRRDLGLQYRIGFEEEDVESYRNRQFFSRLKVSAVWHDSLKIYAAHSLEDNRTTKLPGTVTRISLRRYGRLEEQDFLISSLVLGCNWSSVDDVLAPTSGMNISYDIESALDSLGSEFQFLRQTGEWKGYFRLFNTNIVVAGRTRLGTVDPVTSDDYIPIANRFFAGGSSSVRGYPYQEVGSLDENGNPLGGFSLLEYSMEGRIPVTDKIRLVTFVDGGNVFAEPYRFDVTNIYYSAGMGVRFSTPVGPIRLDLAYKLNPETTAEDRFRVHVNLGEAF